MVHTKVFDAVILIGRPAAGKSEVIDYLKNTAAEDRAERFHIGAFEEVDDFPMIWSWFEEDAILAKHGHERLHTDADGYFLDNFFWHVLVERVEQEYWKVRDERERPDGPTVILEFSRGSEHGGYREAFAHLSADLLRRAAIMYIDVPYEESLRKNRRRFNPQKPHSILEHALPDEKLSSMYGTVDWEDVVSSQGTVWSGYGVNGGPAGTLRLGDVDVPFAVFPNADDVTTPGGDPLGCRLETTLSQLWAVRSSTYAYSQ
ncbi:MAG: hypothetical protein ACLFM0_08995 [Spirochaetales bacterium]